MGKMMKKRWLAFTALLLAGAGGYWAFEANKYRIPGIVQDWNDPVQPNRAVAWQQGPTQAPEGKRPPNIILIVADDLGYNDISPNGGGVARVVKTPNIDALAREGVNFTTAYAANATCSPSRAAMFLPEDDPDSVNAKLPWDPIDRFIWANLRHAVTFNGSKRFHPQGHMTDYFADEAIEAIEANRNRPFFLYLAFNAPHTPLQATKADYDRLPEIKDHKTRVYGAMIAQLDRRIGDVMAKLKEAGIDDNTLVIFTSDNGGAWYNGMSDLNAPFRGWKATFFEGGIRAPLFMRWPGGIAAGTQRADVTGHLDIFATIAAAAGATLPEDRPIDSENILAGPAKRPAMFWRSGDYRAVRAGDWKLQVTKRPEKARLYNLATDPTERHDLAAGDPQRVAELGALIEAQNKGMAKPIWPGLVEGPVRIDVPLNAPWQDGQDYIYWTN